MQDLQEKVELAARDHQDLQAHGVPPVTQDPRAHRVLLARRGTAIRPPALVTAWEVSSWESGSLLFAEVGVAFSNSQSKMEATGEPCTKRWQLPKNMRGQCRCILWDRSTKRRWPQHSDQRKSTIWSQPVKRIPCSGFSSCTCLCSCMSLLHLNSLCVEPPPPNVRDSRVFICSFSNVLLNFPFCVPLNGMRAWPLLNP